MKAIYQQISRVAFMALCLNPAHVHGQSETAKAEASQQVGDAFHSEFSHAGHYVKDYFVYRSPDDGVYHLYYNIGKAGPKQRWSMPFNEEQFGHATSTDLKNWDIQKDYILPVVPGTWESHVVSAPFVVRHNDRFYMAYTGFGPKANQRMGIATSEDLFNWTRIPENPVAVGPSWTKWKEKGWADFRDPALLKWKDQWLAFNTVDSKEKGSAVAISVSDDLIHWEHLGADKAPHVTWGHPESALAFERSGKVYLIASVPLRGGHAQMWVTEDPLSGQWEAVDFDFPEGLWSGWELITSPEGKQLLSAFLWKMNGNFIRFWELEWEGDVPRLVR
jgi:hypothetical protein